MPGWKGHGKWHEPAQLLNLKATLTHQEIKASTLEYPVSLPSLITFTISHLNPDYDLRARTIPAPSLCTTRQQVSEGLKKSASLSPGLEASALLSKLQSRWPGWFELRFPFLLQVFKPRRKCRCLWISLGAIFLSLLHLGLDLLKCNEAGVGLSTRCCLESMKARMSWGPRERGRRRENGSWPSFPHPIDAQGTINCKLQSAILH